MKCIDCPIFYYRGGEFGYCRESGKVIDWDNEETDCKHIEYFIEV